MNDLDDRKLDVQLQNALSVQVTPDFDAFRSRHADAVAYLNPVVTAMAHRRRQRIARIASLAVAATILLAVCAWVFAPRGSALAQAVQTMEKAETISMTITFYTRKVSEDGQRTWLLKDGRMDRAFMAPNYYRDTRYGQDGTVYSVHIEDTVTGKVLQLDMRKKTATLKNNPSGQFGGGKPFDGIAESLKKETVEYAGQREVNGVRANVFRYARTYPHGDRNNFEVWLDPKSKHLVGYSTSSWFPGYHSDPNEFFDPANVPDRNNPPEVKYKHGEMAGSITSDIVFDAKLDPKLFSLTPPEGFEIVEEKPRPKITEERLIEWLRVTAHVNDDQFVDSAEGLSRERARAISDKLKTERSEAELQYVALAQRNALEDNRNPIRQFADDSTEFKTFRYLGKGVKLSDTGRIVCFYKLKGSNKYRAVYGDLTVKDVEAKDLPLPVDE